MIETTEAPVHHETQELESVVIRFSGDSGDGMQLTGTQFTDATAVLGNDLSTFPEFPAEIRAPAGTLAGVSGFQVHFGSTEIFTPGDRYDVLVAMNAAALKSDLKNLKPHGIIITNTAGFDERDSNPETWRRVCCDGDDSKFRVSHWNRNRREALFLAP